MSDTRYTQCINGPLRVGDLVLSTLEDDFVPCLPGIVTKIDFLGTPEHETQNDMDDVHVDFTGDFTLKRQEEIAQHYSEQFNEQRTFEESDYDELIMGPDCLLNITGVTEDKLKWLRESERNAIAYAYELVLGLLPKKQDALSVTVALPDGRKLTACDKRDAEYPGIKLVLTTPDEKQSFISWAEYNTVRSEYQPNERLRLFLWNASDDEPAINMSYDTGAYEVNS